MTYLLQVQLFHITTRKVLLPWQTAPFPCATLEEAIEYRRDILAAIEGKPRDLSPTACLLAFGAAQKRKEGIGFAMRVVQADGTPVIVPGA